MTHTIHYHKGIPETSEERAKRIVSLVTHAIVLVLSVGLIVFISYDTFANIPLLTDRTYMWFQFIVCILFLADFFISLGMSEDKPHYAATHWFFLLISIPYLNIIDMFNLELSQEAMYYLGFVPLVRGAYSLAMVVGYISSNRATSIVSSYGIILASIIYFAALIFYRQEKVINSDVTSFWDALWWACMNVTTIGCDINPMSVAGKICAVVLAASGMLMLPLFTVMVTDMVKKYNEQQQKRRSELMQSQNPPRKNPGQSNP